MKQFKINPDLVHKKEESKLLLVSVQPDENEVYEFEGKSSLLIMRLIESGLFTLKDAQDICVDLKASPEDLTSLWDLCLSEEIFIPEN